MQPGCVEGGAGALDAGAGEQQRSVDPGADQDDRSAGPAVEEPEVALDDGVRREDSAEVRTGEIELAGFRPVQIHPMVEDAVPQPDRTSKDAVGEVELADDPGAGEAQRRRRPRLAVVRPEQQIAQDDRPDDPVRPVRQIHPASQRKSIPDLLLDDGEFPGGHRPAVARPTCAESSRPGSGETRCGAHRSGVGSIREVRAGIVPIIAGFLVLRQALASDEVRPATCRGSPGRCRDTRGMTRPWDVVGGVEDARQAGPRPGSHGPVVPAPGGGEVSLRRAPRAVWKVCPALAVTEHEQRSSPAFLDAGGHRPGTAACRPACRAVRRAQAAPVVAGDVPDRCRLLLHARLLGCGESAPDFRWEVNCREFW